ncbi:porin [Burkholderia sp. 22PA0106]|uniref:porin n=1 Tax=Burkholderia sp. 22PA0106 TaxID=3237371 RepID=UPI0039C281FC
MKHLKSNVAAGSLIGFAVLAAHGQSSLTLYGNVDAGVQYMSDVGVARNTGSAGTPVVLASKPRFAFLSGGAMSNRWGLKGIEDLGAGLAAIFQLENGFNSGTGAYVLSGTEFNRAAFVGLSSRRFGTLTFGRQADAISGLLVLYGPGFAGGISTYAGDLSNYDTSNRVNNAVKYRTPLYGGWSGEVLYGFGNTAESLNAESAFGVGFNYVKGPLAGGIAYLRMDNSGATGNTWSGSADGNFGSAVTTGFVGARAVQIVDSAVNYVFSKLTVGVNYGFTQYRPSAVSLFKRIVGYNSVGVGMRYAYSPQIIVAGNYSYTRGQSVAADAPLPRYQNLGVSAIYLLSRQTSIYVLGGYQNASGSTLDAYGNVVNAVASIGDIANSFPAGSHNQVALRIGILNKF